MNAFERAGVPRDVRLRSSVSDLDLLVDGPVPCPSLGITMNFEDLSFVDHPPTAATLLLLADEPVSEDEDF